MLLNDKKKQHEEHFPTNSVSSSPCHPQMKVKGLSHKTVVRQIEIIFWKCGCQVFWIKEERHYPTWAFGIGTSGKAIYIKRHVQILEQHMLWSRSCLFYSLDNTKPHTATEHGFQLRWKPRTVEQLESSGTTFLSQTPPQTPDCLLHVAIKVTGKHVMLTPQW